MTTPPVSSPDSDSFPAARNTPDGIHFTHHSRIPSVHSNDWSRNLVDRLVPYFDASNLNPSLIPTISGATAGLVSGIITCPLDVIKTKLQAQGGWVRAGPHASGGHTASTPVRELRYRGLVGTSRAIWAEEGVRGMYRGLGPLILGYLPTWMVYFTVYETTKKSLDGSVQNAFVTHVIAALAGGASSTICTNPIWVIKTRLMSQASAPSGSSPSAFHYKNTLDAFRKMYRHEGLRSFYSGLAPALLGLTHVGVQFPIYEYLKSKFTGGVALGKQGEDGKTNFGGILLASCLSKICASSATYPHEVLRTRLQTQRILNDATATAAGSSSTTSTQIRYQGVMNSVRTIYREEGWRAFYSGMGTNMVRAVPSSAMTLLTYELVNGFITKFREESIVHYGHDREERERID
ncbi:putative mitochondrial carrier protein [Pyronema domesticum]|uniref:Similar to Mitochondrial nicotinamide adenine dinucleotide transporter 1 acc. no. P40556 n=1 Tax=Pyronema omphalodes (strain CBS 100304) TaxID=1076935 RepID=U4KZ05_PYROM|nr:putative mitochondrial carrier protein [Pyronema domesticum]CCX04874.1 Similar to Mitochondrial nicotinamide adenine dinucleotide transporter 1; acc. no. P40556 [Pyronema omphalodes CBS 100304]